MNSRSNFLVTFCVVGDSAEYCIPLVDDQDTLESFCLYQPIIVS